jgi:hypothetical protein
MPSAAEFHKDPSGTVLGRLAGNAAVTMGATRDGWREVTFDGWIPASQLRDDSRDGFDVSVVPGNGAEVRSAPETGAAVRATARPGALFDRLGTRGTWVQVRRTAWVALAATVPQQPVAADTAVADSTARGALAVPGQSVAGGTEFSAVADGPPIGKIEATRSVEVLEQRNGWSRIRLDVWVRDPALGQGPPPGGISAAEVRAEPDRYVGQTVEWSLQVLAVQTADELRPELPLGQPYVLARGPLPETGFVYMVVTGDQVAAFRNLDPLTQVRVRATIRAGKTRFLPTPVLDLVRRLD